MNRDISVLNYELFDNLAAQNGKSYLEIKEYVEDVNKEIKRLTEEKILVGPIFNKIEDAWLAMYPNITNEVDSLNKVSPYLINVKNSYISTDNLASKE